MNEEQRFFEEEDYEKEPLRSRNNLASLFVKMIIEDYTSPYRVFSANDIIDRLDRYPYSLALERKAVSRIINTLKDEYACIVKTDDGRVYYDRTITAA